jgi:CheY-like chemotaxis protein
VARILLVEDDRDQRELRRMLLQHSGHDVDGCTMPLEAEAACATRTPDIVVMDLRLPTAADGRGLVRALRGRHPALPIIVCTGWADDLDGTPEKDTVQAVLRKPIKSEELVKLISQFTLKALCFLVVFAHSVFAQEFRLPFEWSGRGEALATVTLSAPGADWSVQGREGGIAEIRVDDAAPQHVVVATGDRPAAHRLFLGTLPAGRHTLSVRTIQGTAVRAAEARVAPLDPARPEDHAVLHAPVLFARANTLGQWSDVPLFAYATNGQDQAGRWFEYTMVFSNEDGGTSSRNLMARWGRAADIEYVYKVWLDAAGRRVRTLIQTRDHKDVPYAGAWLADHPLLLPVTDNNMVEPAPSASPTPLRFQFAPELIRLDAGARELSMDRQPWSYRVVADELKREGKLRPPLTVDGEKIADPRNYLVVEFRGRYRTSALQVLVRLKGRRDWFSSSAGLPENFLNRPEFARVAIELPPATPASQVEEIAFQCMLYRDPRTRSGPSSGECRVEALGRVFLPAADAAPGDDLRPAFEPLVLRTGDLRAIPLP